MTLKEYRIKNNLKLADIARLLDKSVSWVWLAENEVKISQKSKEYISKKIGIPVEELFPKKN